MRSARNSAVRATEWFARTVSAAAVGPRPGLVGPILHAAHQLGGLVEVGIGPDRAGGIRTDVLGELGQTVGDEVASSPRP